MFPPVDYVIAHDTHKCKLFFIDHVRFFCDSLKMMAHRSVMSRNLARCVVPMLVLVIPTFQGCGASCSQPLTIWPPLGHVPEAVQYIEERTCDIFDFIDVERPDIIVGEEERPCGCYCAGVTTDGHMSYINPSCPTYSSHGTLGSVHELVHYLGHWHHDEYNGIVHSVMEPTVVSNSTLFVDDIEYIIERYCK